MSGTLTERIKYIANVQPDHLMSAFASDLNEIVQRAEAAEARVRELEHDLEVDDWHAAFVKAEAKRDELARKLEQAQRKLDAYDKTDRALNQALNEGDGVYRP